MGSLFKTCHALNKCKVTSSSTKKLELLKSLPESCKIILKDVLRYTLDSSITYGVHPDKKDLLVNNLVSKEFEAEFYDHLPELDIPDCYEQDVNMFWVPFKTILNKLSIRELTGGKARSVLNHFFLDLPYVYRYWFLAIMDRNLKCGVSLGTCDILFPGLIVPFLFGKAATYEGQEFLNDGWYAEPKPDGYRCIVKVIDGKLVPRTSGDGDFYNCDHIVDELTNIFGTQYVLDGEMYAGNWNLTSSIAKTHSEHPQKLDLQFHLFDAIPVHQWDKQVSYDKYVSRRSTIKYMMEGSNTKYVHHVDYMFVKNLTEAKEAVNFYVSQGYEGTVLKDPEGYYNWTDRVWLKLKRLETDDFEIVGVTIDDMMIMHPKLGYPVSTETLTALQFVDEKGIVSGVGSSLTKNDRKELYQLYKDDPNNVIGKFIEVSWQEETKDGKKRFAIYERFRSDKCAY